MGPAVNLNSWKSLILSLPQSFSCFRCKEHHGNEEEKLEERKMKKEVLIHIFHQYPQMSLRWWGSRSAIPTINAKSFFFQFAPNLAHENSIQFNSIQFKLGFLFDQ